MIAGDVDTERYGSGRILLQFKENLNGLYYTEREDDNTAGNYVRTSTQFKSIPQEEFHGFYLTFEILLKHESSDLTFSGEPIKIKGEFLTMLIDIKED